jgi:hypothetical protein
MQQLLCFQVRNCCIKIIPLVSSSQGSACSRSCSVWLSISCSLFTSTTKHMHSLSAGWGKLIGSQNRNKTNFERFKRTFIFSLVLTFAKIILISKMSMQCTLLIGLLTYSLQVGFLWCAEAFRTEHPLLKLHPLASSTMWSKMIGWQRRHLCRQVLHTQEFYSPKKNVICLEPNGIYKSIDVHKANLFLYCFFLEFCLVTKMQEICFQMLILTTKDFFKKKLKNINVYF